VQELSLSSSSVRQALTRTLEMDWKNMETALRTLAESKGFYSSALDADLHLTVLPSIGAETSLPLEMPPVV
jgi:hypothetical protein